MNVKIGNILDVELKKVHSRTYFDRAERNAVFPYVVYAVPSSFQGEDATYNLIWRIDIFSNSGNNITDLEQVTASIINRFHKAVYSDNTMMMRFELDSILQIPDTEESIRRRQLSFNVKYYNKEV